MRRNLSPMHTQKQLRRRQYSIRYWSYVIALAAVTSTPITRLLRSKHPELHNIDQQMADFRTAKNEYVVNLFEAMIQTETFA